MKRRFLSVAMALALCLSLLPATARAEAATSVVVGAGCVDAEINAVSPCFAAFSSASYPNASIIFATSSDFLVGLSTYPCGFNSVIVLMTISFSDTPVRKITGMSL